jgi:hypothetical protein
VDFFEGPFQDEDGTDNPLTQDFSLAVNEKGIPYGGIGIGYGDQIVDNERFGMRRFVYSNLSSAINGAPIAALDYYNYLRGFWRNGQRMMYGGDGLNPITGANPAIPADYMFPGDTDPVNWGTMGIPVQPWTEQTAGNPPGDRRFIQSAGPFTLEPGDFNNITLGVVWARAQAGNPFQSVELVRLADDKAQALFDNCFELVSGPDAPDVKVVELDKELIIYWTNDNALSNNFQENYSLIDPAIPKENTAGQSLTDEQRSYVFEGYLAYQLKDATVSVSDLDDIDKARLIFQCDIENYDALGNPIDKLINYDFDPIMGLSVPKLMVSGANRGVKHSLKVTEDQFAQGDKRLVNYKTYYFLVIAYGYNNFEDYNPNLNSGQTEQFKASRKMATSSIRSYAGIPHPPGSKFGGTILNSGYGDGVRITKKEGYGNAGNAMDITAQSRADIMQNNIAQTVTYEAGKGPVNIYVVDPIRLPSADFELRLNPNNYGYNTDTTRWVMTNLTWLNDNDPSNDNDAVYESRRAFRLPSSELLTEWGLAVEFSQHFYSDNNRYTDPLSEACSITFADSTRPWLIGIPDDEGFSELNWIRSGTSDSEDLPESLYNDYTFDKSADSKWEKILEGTWAPFRVVSQSASHAESGTVINVSPSGPDVIVTPAQLSLAQTPNVDVIITRDKSKWTRVPVLEMQFQSSLAQNKLGTGTPGKMKLRRHKSVDKNGRTEDDPGVNLAEAQMTGPIGMGWFPGYAIDVSTGERLNMAFGEDSWFGSQNGRDMIWNPGTETFNSVNEVVAAGQHWIYVFFNDRNQSGQEDRVGAYDAGAFMYQNLEINPTPTNLRKVFRACGWVGSARNDSRYPMLTPEQGLIPTDVHVRLRSKQAYAKWSPTQISTGNTANAENNWNPLYTFSTKGLAPTTNQTATLESLLDKINVVPNPYYAFSGYEENKLDNRIKIINLPEQCTISIFSLNGTLIRQFKKASPETYQDWDLKNGKNIPISSGVYIIHVDVPEVGEKVLKWFGVMRPTDLDNF